MAFSVMAGTNPIADFAVRGQPPSNQSVLRLRDQNRALQQAVGKPELSGGQPGSVSPGEVRVQASGRGIVPGGANSEGKGQNVDFFA